jgi:tRNA nucleotidyltransferase (CCA-adding enzyme)
LLRQAGQLALGDPQTGQGRHMADDFRTNRRRVGGHADNCKAFWLTFRIGTSFLTQNPKKNGSAYRASARARALARRPELKRLAQIAARLGSRVWIVGGAARDLLLARDVPEVDAAVSGDVERVARAMESEGLGHAVPLSLAEPKVFRVAGKREVDLAGIEGTSIEEDLKRRDFTVNAMAFDLAARKWLDPFGGLADLSAGRLRQVAPSNLAEDPLRVLRAARFIATHGLKPDADTTRTSRRVAPALASVAPERLRAEWIKILEARRMGPALRWAARVKAIGPALGLAPAPARRLARAGPLLDAPALARSEPESRRRLRLAILCARIGLSPGPAATWLAARRYGRSEAGDVGRLLQLVESAGAADRRRDQWAWVRDAGPLAAEALLVYRLLFPGRKARARALARRVGSARRRGPAVSGNDVLAWLSIPPGPAVGRLLAQLEVEKLSGAVRTRREARAWLAGASASAGGSPGIIRGS